MTILFISHDLNVVRGLCSRVMVIYKGVIVEEGLAEEIYEHPAHPYTKLLLEAAIGGDTMELDAEAGKQSAEKCIFYERCPKRREACAHVRCHRRQYNFQGHTGAVYSDRSII